MDADRLLGGFEHLLLLAVMRLGEDAYGVGIRRELIERAGKDVAVGAIYTGLERLERKGFVESWLGEPTPERGGRAKRFYRVTGAGRVAVVDTNRAIRQLSVGVQIKKGDARV